MKYIDNLLHIIGIMHWQRKSTMQATPARAVMMTVMANVPLCKMFYAIQFL